MNHDFRIGEISRFFGLPSSTLRYWEDMGILAPGKGTENNYREYALEDLMTISDVIFYKNLGLRLKQIREMENSTPEQQLHLFEEKLSEIHLQQLQLQQRMEKLRYHLNAVYTLKKLRESPYQKTDIDTDCIVSFDLIEKDKLRRYIENPYLYSRVQHSDFPEREQRGLTVPPDSKLTIDASQIIWKKAGGQYIAFLMKEEITEHFPNDLQEHLKQIQQEYTTGSIISRFLLCAQENGKVFDFYKTFVEILS